MTKQVVVIGGRASGKTTIINQLKLACQDMDVVFVEGGDLSELIEELQGIAVASTLEELALRTSTVHRLQLQIREKLPDAVLHLRSSPHMLSMRIRKRRQEGDEQWRLTRIRNQANYMDAVLPHLCAYHGPFYMPVIFDRGVSLADFLPELRNVLK